MTAAKKSVKKEEKEVGWESSETKTEAKNTESNFVSKADSILGPVRDDDHGRRDERGPRDNYRRDDRRDYDRRDERRDYGRRDYDRPPREFERRDYDRRDNYRRDDRRDDRRDYDRRDERGPRDNYRRDDRRDDRRDYDRPPRDDFRRDDRRDYGRREGGFRGREDRREFDRREERRDDRREERRGNDPSNSLILFGIGYDYTNESLRDEIMRMRVEGIFDVNVVMDRETRRPKGFAFLKFDHVEEAKTAKQIIENAPLIPGADNFRVDFSRERQPRRF